jgi:type III pantothenate kinase
MILAVDIGNTNIKIGAWDNQKLVFVSRLMTNTLKTQDEYAVSLLDVLRLNDCNAAQFDGAIISSVGPPLSLPIKSAVKSVLQTNRVYVVSHGLKTGLNIKIENPSVLGADSVASAVAAASKYPLPCIVVSMGTATVISAIDASGAYIGCSVAPGVVISMEALAEKTAQLPHIALDTPCALIGVNTVESMKSGSIYGAACMLDGMARRMKKELGGTATVVASGGIAQFVIPHCEEEILFDDTLVLEGLKIIYDKNAKPINN